MLNRIWIRDDCQVFTGKLLIKYWISLKETDISFFCDTIVLNTKSSVLVSSLLQMMQ